MISRIVTDADTGGNVDEYLETCFRQVFEQNLAGKEGKAVERLLSEYSSMMLGKDAVSSKGITRDLFQAMKWAMQFGELRIHDLSSADIKIIRKSSAHFPVDIAYGAKIGPDRPGQNLVCGSTIHQVVLLAGIQVLRETACSILNRGKEELPH